MLPDFSRWSTLRFLRFATASRPSPSSGARCLWLRLRVIFNLFTFGFDSSSFTKKIFLAVFSQTDDGDDLEKEKNATRSTRVVRACSRCFRSAAPHDARRWAGGSQMPRGGPRSDRPMGFTTSLSLDELCYQKLYYCNFFDFLKNIITVKN